MSDNQLRLFDTEASPVHESTDRVQRVFLGYERPALPAAVAHFANRYTSGVHFDMAGVLVVAPDGRAKSRLEELFARHAFEQRLAFSAPNIVTMGEFPEYLYFPKLPFASELVQQLTWARALKELDRKELQKLIPHPPADNEDRRWRDLGDLIRTHYRELAGYDRDFKDVLEAGRGIAGFDENEQQRWGVLHQLLTRYHTILDGLKLWDKQSARIVAVKHDECGYDGDIALVCVADLNNIQRDMLKPVLDRTTALIYAPPELAHRFDEFGCLQTDEWTSLPLPVKTPQVSVVEDLQEQAEEVVRRIAALDGKYAASEICVGVPDPATVAQVQRQLTQSGLPNRFGPGTGIEQTPPYKLLTAVADYVERNRLPQFAALVRHPDVAAWLQTQGAPLGWISQLDTYYSEHLQTRLDGDWLGAAEDQQKAYAALHQVYEIITALLAPLRGEGFELPQQRLDGWTAALMDVVMTIYSHRQFDREDPVDRLTLLPCLDIHKVLSSNREVPAALAPSIAAPEAIRLTQQQLQPRVPVLHDQPAIELLSWLPLALNDAPALIVTSVNEGFVPDSVGSVLFLPNALRAELGMDDNARRHARDAYAMDLLLRTRKDVSLIVARRDAENNPLIPSRLLFAADDETVADRAMRFFKPQGGQQKPILAGGLQPGAETSQFAIPQPDLTGREIKRIAPTRFAEYLACPYRFYLRRVLYLKTIDDQPEEMEATTFGTLTHNVLEAFGKSEKKDSENIEEIDRFFRAELDRLVELTFGAHAAAPVSIQIEQLRIRLSEFAKAQAAWAAKGWRILHIEQPGKERTPELMVDGEPFHIHGFIDRIDRNIHTGKYAILDYKTSDAGDGPEKKHRKKGEWVNLQLPMYRHLAGTLDVPMDVNQLEFGYILLPKDVSKTGFAMADWTAADIEEADEVARNVIRNIRRGVFWPPADPPPPFSDELACICQDNVFDPWKPSAETTDPGAASALQKPHFSTNDVAKPF